MRARRQREPGGYSLPLLIMIALGLTMLIGLGIRSNLQSSKDALPHGQGQQLQKLAEAVASYAKANSYALFSNSALAGFGNPRTPTVPELQGNGYLGIGFNGANFFGGGYAIAISIGPSGCVQPACALSGWVSLDTPITSTGNIDPAAVGAALEAIADAGGDGGASLMDGTTVQGRQGAWTMANPIPGNPRGIVVARLPQIAIAYRCAAQSLPWGGGCAATAPMTAVGAAITLANTAPAFTGNAIATCGPGGLWGAAAGSCNLIPTSCNANTLHWSNCAGLAPTTAVGAITTLANTNPGYSGTASATCSPGGTWSSAAGSCAALPSTCPAQEVSWGGGCSGNVPATSVGAGVVVSNTASQFTGTATVACSPDGTWAGPVGNCTAVPASCNAQAFSWGGSCTGAAGVTASGSSASLANTRPGYTGTATAACTHGAWGVASGSCNLIPPADCGSATLSWGAGCSASASGRASGQSQSLVNATGGFSGTATAQCNDGAWSLAAPVCNALPAHCAAGWIYWGSNQCWAWASATSSGGSLALANGSSGYGGAATASCSNGNWSLSALSCAALPAACSSGTVSWGNGCAGPVQASGSGSSQAVTNGAAGRSGSATATCSDGAWSASAGSCLLDCSTSALSWGACGASAQGGASGTSRALTNSNGGYSGAATTSCSDGSWSLSGTSCVPHCPAQTVSWSDHCSAALAQASNGTVTPINNSAANYAGAATAACSGGAWSLSNTSCTGAACGPGTLSWGAGCQAPAFGGQSGQSSPVSNTSAGFTGSATANCNAGSWSLTSTVCNADCGPGTLSWGNCSAPVYGAQSGQSGAINNTAADYTGSATYACTNGTWSAANGTCLANCPATTVAWGAGCGSSVSATTSGANVSVTNARSGYTGSATASCANGAWSTAGTCTANDCPAVPASGTWGDGVWGGSCQAHNIPSVPSGWSGTINNDVAGYTGSFQASCSNGGWGVAGPVCGGTPFKIGSAAFETVTSAACGGYGGGRCTFLASSFDGRTLEVTVIGPWGSCGTQTYTQPQALTVYTCPATVYEKPSNFAVWIQPFINGVFIEIFAPNPIGGSNYGTTLQW